MPAAGIKGRSRSRWCPTTGRRKRNLKPERLLTVEELGQILGRSPGTIQKDLRRNPDAVPPRLVLPNTRLLRWRASEVSAWLDGLARAREEAKHG
jgi:predicted DNA-binding transcriptional regulator AlpA